MGGKIQTLIPDARVLGVLYLVNGLDMPFVPTIYSFQKS